MKRHLLNFLLILAVIALLQPPVTVGQSAPSTWTTDDKLVAAYYFYWYNIYNGAHFIAPDDSDFITNHPPDSYLADFSYTEVSWYRRELLDMMAARIDIALPVFFGDRFNEPEWSILGLQNLVATELALIGEGQAPPKIGLFLDTNSLQYQNEGLPLDVTTDDGKGVFYQMIKDFFDEVPPGLWATIDDRPIVFLYTSAYASAYDQSTFDYLSQHFLADFGTTPYIVRETSWAGVTTDEAYAWGSALNGPTITGRVGTLGPGFDDTNNYYASPPRIRERECGAFYNAGWEAVMNAGATLVVIETWNELHEATEIAASREYGRAYIDLTAENVLRWKATDFGTGPVAWLDFGRDTYQQGLLPAFNYPNGSWLVTTKAGREAAYPDNSTYPVSNSIYLNVNDAFIYATPSEVWLTVEYYDGGTDQWALDYDSVSDPYAPSETVYLQNTGLWKRHTFHLTDAYFGGRESSGADLRLADNGWIDGLANYFGRVWISKEAPVNQAPNLAGLDDVALMVGQVLDIPISATDPDEDPLLLSLDRALDFVTLIYNGDGSGSLHLAPTWDSVQPCSYPIRMIAEDDGEPVLADTISLRVRILTYDLFLPVVWR